ncbi:MAG: NUDIX domain-containing protein [Hyphomicrobium sp.]|jgi:ADP-ribose pyrophosphatase YjhB (NUDIX family)
MTDEVKRVRRCDLIVLPGHWPFSDANAAAIDTLWRERSAKNPRLFNGTIHVMTESAVAAGDTFEGRFLRTDFKSYLYWRESGFPDRSVVDAFGSALIRSAEGHVVLGRQRDGFVNAGLSYLPGGFIDARDVGADGRIDIEASIARELKEETCLDAATLERVPGFYLTTAGPLVSIAAEYRAALPADDLRRAILSEIAHDPNAELVDIVVVKAAPDLEGLPMPDYARVLLRNLFSAEKSA